MSATEGSGDVLDTLLDVDGASVKEGDDRAVILRPRVTSAVSSSRYTTASYGSGKVQRPPTPPASDYHRVMPVTPLILHSLDAISHETVQMLAALDDSDVADDAGGSQGG